MVILNSLLLDHGLLNRVNSHFDRFVLQEFEELLALDRLLNHKD